MEKHFPEKVDILVYHLFQSILWCFLLSETASCNNRLQFHALNIFSVKNPVICDSYLQMVLSLKGWFPESSDAERWCDVLLSERNQSQLNRWFHLVWAFPAIWQIYGQKYRWKEESTYYTWYPAVQEIKCIKKTAYGYDCNRWLCCFVHLWLF